MQGVIVFDWKALPTAIELLMFFTHAITFGSWLSNGDVADNSLCIGWGYVKARGRGFCYDFANIETAKFVIALTKDFVITIC